MIKFENLEKHFTKPRVLSPFYMDVRIPRKLKLKVKSWCGGHWGFLTNGQRLWYYMDKTNPDYKKFLIKQVCN